MALLSLYQARQSATEPNLFKLHFIKCHFIRLLLHYGHWHSVCHVVCKWVVRDTQLPCQIKINAREEYEKSCGIDNLLSFVYPAQQESRFQQTSVFMFSESGVSRKQRSSHTPKGLGKFCLLLFSYFSISLFSVLILSLCSKSRACVCRCVHYVCQCASVSWVCENICVRKCNRWRGGPTKDISLRANLSLLQ